MSIKDQVQAAHWLLGNGKAVPGLTLLLLAVAATSRRRYPKPRYRDGAAFEAFLRDEALAGNLFGPHLRDLVAMPYRGQYTPLEKVLYKLRNALAHEATIDPYVVYAPEQDPENMVLWIDDEDRLVFQRSFVVCLIKMLHNVQENMLELAPIPFRQHNAGVLRGINTKTRLHVSKELRIPLP